MRAVENQANINDASEVKTVVLNDGIVFKIPPKDHAKTFFSSRKFIRKKKLQETQVI